MAPQITDWDDLAFVVEHKSPDSDLVQSTSFGFIDDTDTFYHGQIDSPKAQISLEQPMVALNPVPHDAIFPNWPLAETELRNAPDMLTPNAYIKRPRLELYSWLKERGLERQIFTSLLGEAQVLEELSQHPHPNLIRYHGCRVVNGHFTGVVLERHPRDLEAYVERGHKAIDTTRFMAALESAIQHLHGLGWAHNDLKPSNILVSEAGMPILIDFEGCQKLGTALKYIRGSEEWIEGDIESYNTSEAQHDIFALGKIREWLERPLRSSAILGDSESDFIEGSYFHGA
ncbi:unnamed protein product [Penicillium salamii]|uniref:Protein kinase domain-containing protein n=1 Tax=Penicillium salamii TaxID=1612424 RepID=A0A9W4NEJ1_9EURO|nr:unnamed protein product [Penicillium salamii]